MGLLESLGLGALVLLGGVLLGAKLGTKSGVGRTAEIEHKSEVAADKAKAKVAEVTEAKVATVRAEADKAKRSPVSDVLSGLIERGEVKQ